jgi:hypothetical protein
VDLEDGNILLSLTGLDYHLPEDILFCSISEMKKASDKIFTTCMNEQSKPFSKILYHLDQTHLIWNLKYYSSICQEEPRNTVKTESACWCPSDDSSLGSATYKAALLTTRL